MPDQGQQQPPTTLMDMACAGLRARSRIRGLRLQATDLDWAFGKGPEVRGPGEALLMAMAGRRQAVGELTSPGQPRLAARMPT